jgi:hypothetical protein
MSLVWYSNVSSLIQQCLQFDTAMSLVWYSNVSSLIQQCLQFDTAMSLVWYSNVSSSALGTVRRKFKGRGKLWQTDLEVEILTHGLVKESVKMWGTVGWNVWCRLKGPWFESRLCHCICFQIPNPPSRTVALGFTQPLTEMGKARPTREADNLTATSGRPVNSGSFTGSIWPWTGSIWPWTGSSSKWMNTRVS